jgi:hypothetical protein
LLLFGEEGCSFVFFVLKSSPCAAFLGGLNSVDFGGKSSKLNTSSSIIDFDTFLGSTNIAGVGLVFGADPLSGEGIVVDFGGDIDSELGGDPTGLDLGLFCGRVDCFFWSSPNLDSGDSL